MHLSRRNFLAAGLCAAGCSANQVAQIPAERATIEVFSRELEALVPANAVLETLSTGYQWAEGPAWDPSRKALYFSDVPQNKAYLWRAEDGVSVFLDPSGVTDAKGFREPGANGLLVGNDGRLLVCNHGRRAIEAMDLDTKSREVLVEKYNGRRFNSPNDVIESKGGDLYFTDPPYGLEGLNGSPLKELDANGVYHLARNGKLQRIIADMSFPNGVALSPDETHLYISQSDPTAPNIRRLNLQDGVEERAWFNASGYMQDGPGLPDGMAVSISGHIFATGPGGVFVLRSDGAPLGRINPGRACANCAFGEDGHSLFITAQDRLMRIRLKARGLGWT